MATIHQTRIAAVRHVPESFSGRHQWEIVKKRILVIDDAIATLRLLEVALGREGYEVVTEVDGTSGLASSFEQTPDLIILDIALPDLDGWEVLARLREDDRTVDVPVLMMSAHDTDDIRGRADLTSASAFIGKPFEPEHLRELAGRLLKSDD
jgi:DNA-binding response OmpR family regulator